MHWQNAYSENFKKASNIRELFEQHRESKRAIRMELHAGECWIEFSDPKDLEDGDLIKVHFKNGQVHVFEVGVDAFVEKSRNFLRLDGSQVIGAAK